jgi:hypothetical protein
LKWVCAFDWDRAVEAPDPHPQMEMTEKMDFDGSKIVARKKATRIFAIARYDFQNMQPHVADPKC